MADVFTEAKRSEVMARIPGRGNKDTELALVRVFRTQHITGWRRQVLLSIKVSGSRSRGQDAQDTTAKTSTSRVKEEKLRIRPDFVFPKLKLAVFVDGCFWHGCPLHATRPKNNADFWRKKLDSNKARDRLVTRVLRQAGWQVLRIWEHDLHPKHQTRLVRRLEKALGICKG